LFGDALRDELDPKLRNRRSLAGYNDPVFWQVTRTTFVYTIVGTLLKMVGGLGLASSSRIPSVRCVYGEAAGWVRLPSRAQLTVDAPRQVVADDVAGPVVERIG
jgi:hypothetical protein